MASKAPRVSPYRPRRDRTWKRRRDRRHTQAAPTLTALLTVIPSLTRAELGRMVQRMIDRMDVMDGDTDFEDGNDLEDDFRLSDNARRYGGSSAGCEISEPDSFSYSEWHTRDWRTKRLGGPEMASTATFADHEDAEDDDPLEEDDPSDCDVLDMELDEDAVTLSPIYGEDQSLGPINAVHANQRHDLLRQIADHSDGGDPGFVRQLRQRLRAIDARAAANA